MVKLLQVVFTLFLLTNSVLAQSVYIMQNGSPVGSDNPLVMQGGPAPAVSSSTTEPFKVLKSSAGSLISLHVVTGANDSWLMLFDASSAPSDGAVSPKWSQFIPSNGTNGYLDKSWDIPLSFATGITAVLSSTGPFTKTALSQGVFSAQVK